MATIKKQYASQSVKLSTAAAPRTHDSGNPAFSSKPGTGCSFMQMKTVPMSRAMRSNASISRRICFMGDISFAQSQLVFRLFTVHGSVR